MEPTVSALLWKETGFGELRDAWAAVTGALSQSAQLLPKLAGKSPNSKKPS